MDFSSGLNGIKITVEKAIVDDSDVSVPLDLESPLNRISENKYKFGYKFTHTDTSSRELGVKIIINSSTPFISVNSTGINNGFFDVDFSDAIESGFTVTITKELETSAGVVIKKTFNAGVNTIIIDPTVVGVGIGTNANTLNMGWFQNRITYINNTVCIFSHGGVLATGVMNYTCSFSPFISFTEPKYLLAYSAPDGSTLFDVQFNATNISIFFKTVNASGIDVQNISRMEGLTVTGRGNDAGNIVIENSGVSHVLFDNGVSLFTTGTSGGTVYYVTNKTGTDDFNQTQILNASDEAGDTPSSSRLNRTHGIITSIARIGNPTADIAPIVARIFNSETGALGSPELVLRDGYFNVSTRALYLPNVGIVSVIYPNSSQKDSSKRDSVIGYEVRRSLTGSWSVIGNISNDGITVMSDGGNRFFSNVTCSANQNTSMEFCFLKNATGIYVTNVTIDANGNGNWSGFYLAISRTIDESNVNAGQITSLQYAVSNGTHTIIPIVWTEGSDLLFDAFVIASSPPTPPNPPINTDDLFLWNSNVFTIHLNTTAAQGKTLNVSSANITYVNSTWVNSTDVNVTNALRANIIFETGMSLANRYLQLSGGTLTGSLVSQIIQPSADASYNLGSPTSRWLVGYFTQMNISQNASFNWVNSSEVSSARLYQDGLQVIDTLVGGSSIEISSSGNSRSMQLVAPSCSAGQILTNISGGLTCVTDQTGPIVEDINLFTDNSGQSQTNLPAARTELATQLMRQLINLTSFEKGRVSAFTYTVTTGNVMDVFIEYSAQTDGFSCNMTVGWTDSGIARTDTFGGTKVTSVNSTYNSLPVGMRNTTCIRAVFSGNGVIDPTVFKVAVEFTN